MPDGDVVVKPTYLRLDYSLVIEQTRPGEEVYGYINGNNYINTVYPNAIGALPTISNINDENYDFVGWFLDDMDGSQLTTSYVPHEETPVVAYAHYEQKRAQYTVKHYKMTTEGEYEVDVNVEGTDLRVEYVSKTKKVKVKITKKISNASCFLLCLDMT